MSRRLALGLVASLVLVAGLFWLRSESERPVASAPADAPVEEVARSALEPSEPPSAESAEGIEEGPPASRAALTTEEPVEEEDERVFVTISARFVDPEGRALPGAELSAASIANSPVAVSGAEGYAELVLDWEQLRGFHPQPCSFLMRAPGFTTRGDRQWFGQPEDRFLGEIPMELGGSVRGRVVDEGGAGVAGARIASVHAVLADSPERRQLKVWGGQPVSARTTSGNTGAFLLEGLPLLALSVDAQGDGTFHAISEPVTIRAGEAIEIPDLVLEPAPEGRRIAGVVRTEAGESVQGAGVRLLDEERAYIRGRVLTDEGGGFRFTVTPGEVYALQVLDYSANGWPDVNLDGIEPGTTDLEIHFQDTRILRVVVTDPDGRPVRRFNATTLDNRIVPGGHATSEDGRPVELRVPKASYRLGVHAPGYEYQRLGPFEAENTQGELVVKLERTNGIRGRVLADGRPLAGVPIDAHAAFEEGRRGLAADVFHVFVQTRGFLGDVTGSEGEFFLNAPQAASLHVHAKAEGYARAESGRIDFDPAQGDFDLVLELPRGGAVAGRVLVGSGEGPSGRTIALSRGDGHFETQVTGADGTYHFEDLTPGAWQIAEVDPRELERATSGALGRVDSGESPPWDFEVVAGETTSHDLDVTNAERCHFAGRFLVDGEPPIGWRWSLPLVRGLFNQTFDAEGRFVFEVEESGQRTIQLVAPRTPGAYSGVSLEVELLPGANRWEGSVITGKLELSGLEAPSWGDVDLGGQIEIAYTLLNDLEDGLRWFSSVYAADGGALRLISVPAGRIRVFEGDKTRVIGGAPPQPLVEIELAPGMTKRVALD